MGVQNDKFRRTVLAQKNSQINLSALPWGFKFICGVPCYKFRRSVFALKLFFQLCRGGEHALRFRATCCCLGCPGDSSKAKIFWTFFCCKRIILKHPNTDEYAHSHFQRWDSDFTDLLIKNDLEAWAKYQSEDQISIWRPNINLKIINNDHKKWRTGSCSRWQLSSACWRNGEHEQVSFIWHERIPSIWNEQVLLKVSSYFSLFLVNPFPLSLDNLCL